MMALELVALTSFAFTRPVLSMFGDAPEWFISRDASRADIVGFALVVAIVPAAVLTLVGLASRLLGEVQDSEERGGKLVQAVLAPWLFEDGANDLEAFLVTGATSGPTLAPLPSAGAGAT